MKMRLALTFLTVSIASAVEAPGWLKELGQSSLPEYPPKVSAAVLLNEETITLEATGRRLRTTRYAVRILNREGASHASQGEYYFTDTGKVRDMKGWLIMPSGKVKEYGKAEIVESGVASGLYDQAKYRAVNAGKDADPGATFGFEATIEEKVVFRQFIFDFQYNLPVLRSAFVLNLPPGWTVDGKMFQGLVMKPAIAEVSGSRFRWQKVNLPPFEREPSAPRGSTQNPRLVVTAHSPGETNANSFQTWRDVSAWDTQASDASALVTTEVQSMANKLTANANTPWEKVKALAEVAQRLRYESIQLNLSRGGGYIPRPAAMVMTKGYGDCKDKANYLRTLLKAIGVDSYMISIFSGDPRRTRKEWPSLMQFNHAILAIRVPNDTSVPAAFDFPGIGRLVLFDPTDDTVPLGFLPEHEQDSFALLAAGDKGDIFKTPSTAPSVNHLETKALLKVNADGDLTASITEAGTGQEAFNSIKLLKHRPLPEYLKMMERRVARSAAGANLSKVDPKGDIETGRFTLALDFTARGYAKMMQRKLMMVNPVVLRYAGVPNLADPKRTQPLLVYPASFKESIELEIPDGYTVDEMPASGNMETAFGRFKASFRTEGNKVFVERELELRSAWIAVENFKEAREFFSKIGGTEQSPVVLVRK